MDLTEASAADPGPSSEKGQVTHSLAFISCLSLITKRVLGSYAAFGSPA